MSLLEFKKTENIYILIYKATTVLHLEGAPELKQKHFHKFIAVLNFKIF